jgi:hypothetical protein
MTKIENECAYLVKTFAVFIATTRHEHATSTFNVRRALVHLNNDKLLVALHTDKNSHSPIEPMTDSYFVTVEIHSSKL